MENVVQFPAKPVVQDEILKVTLEEMFAVMARRKTMDDIRIDRLHEAYLNQLRPFDVATLRRFWDEVDDDTSYYVGPEGSFDCADIHRVLNEKGDGLYCAV